MSRIITNPAELHDPSGFGYSHVAHAENNPLVFIAGQYGSGADGQVVASDFDTQAERAFDNLGTALRAVGLDYPNVLRLGTFVVDHDLDRLATIGKLVDRHWGKAAPAQTLIQVAGLALPGMLFEVDAVAVRF